MRGMGMGVGIGVCGEWGLFKRGEEVVGPGQRWGGEGGQVGRHVEGGVLLPLAYALALHFSPLRPA